MKKTISIIGGGPAGMLCASFLDHSKYDVTIYEKNKALGRKFLVAGKGGFNLTHSEEMVSFSNRYTPNTFLKEAFSAFNNEDLRSWLAEIGIPTFVGSSGRVYPEEGIKPIEVLGAIVQLLQEKNVNIVYNKVWKGWNSEDELVFENKDTVSSDYVIFALGGGSWQVTGSEGNWLDFFSEKGIKTVPFYPSNCGYQVRWRSDFITKNAGKPLKNITISCGSISQKGEAVTTDFGLEGNAIYGLSPQIRKQLQSVGKAEISIDLKPMLTEVAILKKLTNSSHKLTDSLKKDLKLSKPAIDLLKSTLDKESFLDTKTLAKSIKELPLEVIGVASLDEAISSVGGIALDQIDESYQLTKIPKHYCLGEMLDWDAPTGGYLLQACFSMGVCLADYFNQPVTLNRLR